ncbi:MAG: hypothetical protein Q9M31_05550 [Mariprofundus sp.]|nr:hypothetical protein [Mariprofundus sp.]
MSRIQGVLVAAIPANISSDGLISLFESVLQRLETEETLAVVINMQQLKVTETALMQTLDKALRMIQIMGVPTSVAGMQPGLITALVHLDINTDNLYFAKDVQRAIRQMQRSSQHHA